MAVNGRRPWVLVRHLVASSVRVWKKHDLAIGKIWLLCFFAVDGLFAGAAFEVFPD